MIARRFLLSPAGYVVVGFILGAITAGFWTAVFILGARGCQ